MDDLFWKDNPRILFDLNKLKEFYPRGDMSFNRKLNAMSRFIIYFSIILFLVYGNLNSISILVLGLTVIYLIHLYKIEIKFNINPRENANNNNNNNVSENFMSEYLEEIKDDQNCTSLLPEGLFKNNNSQNKSNKYLIDEDTLNIKYSKKNNDNSNSCDKTDVNKTEDKLSGYSDPGYASVDQVKDAFTPPGQKGGGGDCNSCSPSNSPYNPRNCEKGNKLGLDANMNMCQMPSKDNPFMNVLVTDYADNPNKLPACNPEIVKNDINNMWSQNLFRNINDVWDKNNGQQRYNTQNWTTIPNDRESYQKWLYDIPYVCKDGDMAACYRGAELQLPQMRPGKIF